MMVTEKPVLTGSVAGNHAARNALSAPAPTTVRVVWYVTLVAAICLPMLSLLN